MNRILGFISIFIIILLQPTGQKAVAQNNKLKLSYLNEEQTLIKAMADSSLFIVRQDYVLKNRKNKNDTIPWVKGDNDYYGRVYGLAILSDGKYWIDSKLLKPWLFDENFKGKTNDSLFPALSTLSIKGIKETKYRNWNFLKEDSLKSPNHIFKEESTEIQVQYYELKDSLSGITTVYNSCDSLGWLILAYTDAPISLNDTAPVNIFPYKPKPSFIDSSNITEIKNPPCKNIVGGGYYIVKTSRGKAEIKLAGILINIYTNWYIVSISEKNIKKNMDLKHQSRGHDKKNKPKSQKEEKAIPQEDTIEKNVEIKKEEIKKEEIRNILK